MKKITDPSKLLPAAKSTAVKRVKKATIKPSSALVRRDEKESALVKSPQKASALAKKENKNIEYVNVRMIAIENLFRNDLTNVKKEAEEKRKKEERQNFEAAEKKLETPKSRKLNLGGGGDSPSLGFFDRIKRFLFFTALGWLLPKIIEFLPKLQGVLETIGTVYKFAEGLFGKLFDGFMTLVKFGGDLKEKTIGFIAGLKGGDYQTTFNRLEKNFDTFINAAIVAGVLAADIGSSVADQFKKPQRPERGGRRGGDGGGRGGRSGGYSYDRSRSLVRTKYGENAARIYDNEIRNGKSPSQALRNIKNRYIKTRRITPEAMGTLGNSTRAGGVFRRGFQSVGNRAVIKTIGKQGGKQLLKLVKAPLARIPLIGGLIEFGLSWALGEPVGKAAFRGIGTILLGAVGSLIAPGIGTILGGVAGAELAGLLYEILFENKRPVPKEPTHNRRGRRLTRSSTPTSTSPITPGPTARPNNRRGRIRAHSVGGRVVNAYQSGGTARTTRRGLPKPSRIKKPIRDKPPETKIGRDVGGEKTIVDFYSKEGGEETSSSISNFAEALRTYDNLNSKNKEQNRPLNALRGISKVLKGLPFGLGYFAGGAIDIALGQSMDVKRGLSQMSSSIAYLVDSLANQRVNMSVATLMSDLNAFAEGGSVPATRTLATPYDSISSKDIISKVIGPSIEQKVNEAIQKIEKDLKSFQQHKSDEAKRREALRQQEDGGGTGSSTISDTRFSAEINEASSISGMSAAQITAMMEIESGFSPRADSGYAQGLMQIAPATYRELYQKYGSRYSLENDIFNTRTNTILGSLYMRDLYNGPANRNLETMVKMYNAGPAGNLSGREPTNHWIKFQRAYDKAKVKETQVQDPSSQMQATGGTIPSSRFIVSGYGERMHPVFREMRMHHGVDYSGGDFSAGKPISVIKPGTVIDVNTDRWGGGYGNFVVIKHDDGTYSFYSHLEDVKVRERQRLSFSGGFAPVIGTVGNTGVSTGAHLHFEVGSGWNRRHMTGRINPEPVAAQYFRGGGRVKVQQATPRAGDRREYDVIIPLDHHPSGRVPDKSLWPKGSAGASNREREAQGPTAEHVRRRLEAKGLKVKIMRPEDYRTEADYNAALVRYSKAGAVVTSLHYDAPRSAGGIGFLVRLGASSDKNDRDFANKLAPILRRMAAESKGDHGYGGIDTVANATMRHSGPATAALIELGALEIQEKRYGRRFWTNPEFVRHLDAIADVTASSVQRNQSTPPTSVPRPPTRPATPPATRPATPPATPPATRPATPPASNTGPQIRTVRQLGDAIKNLKPGETLNVPGVGKVLRDREGNAKYFVDGMGEVPAVRFIATLERKFQRRQQGGIISPRGTQLPIPNSYTSYNNPAGSATVLIQPYIIEKPPMTTRNSAIAFPVLIGLNSNNKNIEALSRG